MALPDFLIVCEAVKVLDLGRTAAYELAARDEATDAAEGLPVVRLGQLMRVPRARLEDFADGPLTDPSEPKPSPTSRRRPNVARSGTAQAGPSFGD
jgi:hypothetical protein